jgi:hypothetical protein
MTSYAAPNPEFFPLPVRLHLGRTRTGPKRNKTEAPHWKEVLRWSLQWPHDVEYDLELGMRTVHEQVVGRWRVRVA